MNKPTLTLMSICLVACAAMGAAPAMAADAPAPNMPVASGKPEAMKDVGAPAVVYAAPPTDAKLADAPPAPMSAEEKRKARQEARREAQQKAAAERAAAEKARLEEEIRLCVIKPVMTDAEINSCRTAGKRRS